MRTTVYTYEYMVNDKWYTTPHYWVAKLRNEGKLIITTVRFIKGE